jgi:hypothetical protein
MADEQIATRKDHLHDSLIWTRIFGSFRVALDPKKLLLAAAGILVMSIGWWLLASLFYNTRGVPSETHYEVKNYENSSIKDDKSREENAVAESRKAYQSALRSYELIERTAGPNGTLSTFPWYEDRGPNPFLVVERALIARTRGEEAAERVPLVQKRQLLVLIEPLTKFLAPVIYMFHPDADFGGRIYFFLVILWTLATWALFGAAITRMAAVQFARNEKIGMTEAVRFAWSRYMAFFSAPIFPLILIAVLAIFLVLYGLVGVLTVFIGDIFIYGLLWPIVIVFGLIMAVVLVGLVGWPMMYSTISTEGSDSFDALSRSYSYVYQAPWHYLWYSLVAVAYGVVGVFFIGLMGSLTVYMGKWGVSQAPLAQRMNREPSYLFVWAPTSFGWRELLLSGSSAVYSEEDIRRVGSPSYIDRLGRDLPADKKIAEIDRDKIDRDIQKDVAARQVPFTNADIGRRAGDLEKTVVEDIRQGRFYRGAVTKRYWDSFNWWNYIGAFLVAFWLYLVFLLVVGFGYSYFWCASAIIYLLMRRRVDDTEMDEVHLEEEEMEESYTPPGPAAPSGKPAASSGLIAPESLTLRSPPLETATAPPLDAGAPPAAPEHFHTGAGDAAPTAPSPEHPGGNPPHEGAGPA